MPTLAELLTQLQKDAEAGGMKERYTRGTFAKTEPVKHYVPCGDMTIDDDNGEVVAINRGHGPDDYDRPEPTGFSD